MIETPQALFNERGEVNLLPLVSAARGRCLSVHFGPYDYTASRSIAASPHLLSHFASDFAREVMQVDGALEALALRGADHVDLVAGLEAFDADRLAGLEPVDRVEPDLAEVLDRRARLLEVAEPGLRLRLFFDRALASFAAELATGAAPRLARRCSTSRPGEVPKCFL